MTLTDHAPVPVCSCDTCPSDLCCFSECHCAPTASGPASRLAAAAARLLSPRARRDARMGAAR